MKKGFLLIEVIVMIAVATFVSAVILIYHARSCQWHREALVAMDAVDAAVQCAEILSPETTTPPSAHGSLEITLKRLPGPRGRITGAPAGFSQNYEKNMKVMLVTVGRNGAATNGSRYHIPCVVRERSHEHDG